ncbi:2-C-methyl-D-erythritol 2,4-cyclodiphosphate synthase [Lentisphaerota bacterium WC36G]|nr:2-C-methyl-D-erythritol 2,4-cyclodiphosphate synthase [Lentisphaerae bacterium WC36]
MRIGSGYDVHKLIEKRQLILCGVEIDYHLGLLGHSDADVALHAIADAILGALALGDIGNWFPDNDPQYKGISSMLLLKYILDSKELQSWALGNLDLTIIAQHPKLTPFIQQMRQNLSELFDCDLTQISVKATTTEKLGFTGRGEGIAAEAVVLMVKK